MTCRNQQVFGAKLAIAGSKTSLFFKSYALGLLYNLFVQIAVKKKFECISH